MCIILLIFGLLELSFSLIFLRYTLLVFINWGNQEEMMFYAVMAIFFNIIRAGFSSFYEELAKEEGFK